MGTRLCPPARTRPVFGAELGEHANGLVNRFRNVTNERRGLHEWQFLRTWQGDIDKLTMPLSTSQRSASIAVLEPEPSLTDRDPTSNKRNM